MLPTFIILFKLSFRHTDGSGIGSLRRGTVTILVLAKYTVQKKYSIYNIINLAQNYKIIIVTLLK
ncbi:hypothetical protein Hanom_Chr06g00544561 [Helianthus anomalus]